MKQAKQMICFLLVCYIMLVSGGCASSEADASAGDAAPSTTSSSGGTDASIETQKSTEEGELDGCYVKILDAETGLKDYEGNPMIGVKFEFTNNSEEATSFGLAVYPKAFQDGVELETAFVTKASDEYDNNWKDIKTGVTLTCEQYYILTSDTSDVELVVEPLISFSSATLEKTFHLS